MKYIDKVLDFATVKFTSIIYIVIITSFLTIVGLFYFSCKCNLYSERKVVMIDNCQYIEFYNGRGWNITHKGDCTNEIHRLQVNMKW